MVHATVRFELGQARWEPERDSVEFPGLTEFGPVDFLITRDALAYILSPDMEEIDSETAIEAFFEFESDIHRIARRAFLSRLGGEPPILITVSDIEEAGRPVRDVDADDDDAFDPDDFS